MTPKQAMTQVKIQAEACKKLRAWITGYEDGSGKKVLAADHLRLLLVAIDHLKEPRA